MHHGQISKPIADGLLELRSRIEKGGVPSSKLDETLNLACGFRPKPAPDSGACRHPIPAQAGGHSGHAGG